MGDRSKSKFWTAAGASSEEEESDIESEEEEEIEETAAPARKTGYFSSDDDDDLPQRRVVKSKKDKLLDEMRTALRDVKNHAKIDDAGQLLSDYDNVMKLLSRAPQTGLGNKPPKLILAALADLEDWSNTAPKLNAAGHRFANLLKQRLRKGAKALEAEMTAWRANPDLGSEAEKESGEEESEEESAESGEESGPEGPEDEGAVRNKWLKRPSNEEGSDDEEDEDESGDDDEVSGIDKWRKKEPAKKDKTRIRVSDSDDDEEHEGDSDKSDESEAEEGEEKKEEDEEARARREEEERKAREAEEKKDLTPEEVARRLGLLLAAVGRKKTDAARQIEQLQFLSRKATQPLQRLQVLVALASAQINAGVVRATSWRACAETVQRVLSLLRTETGLTLDETDQQASAAAVAAAVASAGADLAPEGTMASGKVSGNILVMVERLDDDLTRSLQQMDPHSSDYPTRMGDENVLLDLLAQAQEHYAALNVTRSAVTIAARRVERLYYVKERGASNQRALLRELELLVYANGTERQRARVALCIVYYDANNDRFHDARDLLLRTRLQEVCAYADVETQILFNRAMVQLGLSAFRKCLITEAHGCLSDLYAAPTPARELLGQGISPSARFSQEPRDAKQEAAERRRQLPYHMHVNLELVEAAHLISAMLLEAPLMAAAQASSSAPAVSDSRKRVISRYFRRQLDYHERQIFTGPPQNTREVVIAATKALLACDWRRCVELVQGLKVWAVVPNAEAVKALLRQRVQEEGLRVFMLSLSQHYASISVERLVEMFELPLQTVHSILAKMIIGEEVRASLDQPTGALVPQRVEPNRLQSLSLAVVDKASYFVETNERLLDAKTGAYGYNKGSGAQDSSMSGAQQGQYYGGYRQGGMRGGQQRGGRGGYQRRGGYQGSTGGRQYQGQRTQNQQQQQTAQ
eukprot:m51a1_g1 putative eukaryotic translation initiation factor 3 subunit c (926) ;mRNA; r:2375-5735